MSEWLCGRRVVAETLRGSNRDVHDVLIEEGPRSRALEAIVEAAKDRGVELRRAASGAFEELGLEDAQRVAARCGPFRYADAADIPAGDRGDSSILVVLDHLEDPQNTGAVLRSAEVAGCVGACIPKRRAAQVSPAVVRASAGATEHLAVFQIGNVASLLGQLKELGYWTVALDGGARQRWDEVEYRGHIALVIGSEGRGVQRLVRERCDFRVSLPVEGNVDSLNASAAFAAVLYEVVRQQRG